MGETYLHQLVRKEAMRPSKAPGSDWPYLEWECDYVGGRKCDICFVDYPRGDPYAGFEIKVLNAGDARRLCKVILEDIVKHQCAEFKNTANPVERYSVVVLWGRQRAIDSGIEILDPYLKKQAVRWWDKTVDLNPDDQESECKLRVEVLKYECVRAPSSSLSGPQ